MSVTILTPPAVEPISLAEAKLYLRVDHTDEDVLINTLIAAASGSVEQICGRALITRSIRETLDDWRVDELGAAILPTGPVSAVNAVRLIDEHGVAQVIDPAVYFLDGARDRPRLIFESGVPVPLRAVAGIEVDFQAGFGLASADVPAALRAAILLVIAGLYESRLGEGAVPSAARALLGPFTPMRLWVDDFDER